MLQANIPYPLLDSNWADSCSNIREIGPRGEEGLYLINTYNWAALLGISIPGFGSILALCPEP